MTSYVAVGPEDLGDYVSEGDEIECPRCGQWHELKSSSSSGEGKTVLLYYMCWDNCYLAAINNQLILKFAENAKIRRKNDPVGNDPKVEG